MTLSPDTKRPDSWTREAILRERAYPEEVINGNGHHLLEGEPASAAGPVDEAIAELEQLVEARDPALKVCRCGLSFEPVNSQQLWHSEACRRSFRPGRAGALAAAMAQKPTGSVSAALRPAVEAVVGFPADLAGGRGEESPPEVVGINRLSERLASSPPGLPSWLPVSEVVAVELLGGWRLTRS
jgi:hypothetical protein